MYKPLTNVASIITYRVARLCVTSHGKPCVNIVHNGKVVDTLDIDMNDHKTMCNVLSVIKSNINVWTPTLHTKK